jgi:drug/metabolite transporter (DMT)-like permease
VTAEQRYYRRGYLYALFAAVAGGVGPTFGKHLAPSGPLEVAALVSLIGGAVRTLLVFSTTSVFGSVFALVFLGEELTPVQVLGGVFVLLGIYLIQRSDRPGHG